MSQQNSMQPQLPRPPHGQLEWMDLYGSAKGLTIANAALHHNGTLLVITPDSLSASQLETELEFFIGNNHALPVFHFPDWETLPYDSFSPHQDIISDRINILSQLPHLKKGIVVVSVTTLMHRTAPRDYLSGHGFFIKTGSKIHLDSFRLELEKNGYNCVQQVIEHGEFSVRGSIIDLFPMGAERPYRIDLFDDEIDSIRTFDPETQRSLDKIDQIDLLPAFEFPLTKESIKFFREKWREKFSGNPLDSAIYQDISDGHYSPGVEYYLPLFFQQTNSLIDYCPENTVMIRYDSIQEKMDQFSGEVSNRYEQLRHDIKHPVLPPQELFLSKDDLFNAIKPFSQIRLTQADKFANEIPPSLQIDHKAKKPLHLLQSFLENHSAKICFCAETQGRRESLLNLLHTISIKPTYINSWQDCLKSSEQYLITIAPIDEGLICQDPKIILIAESQLFGQRVFQHRKRKKSLIDSESIVKNLTELHIGDPVVHIDHGVGKFLGLQTITVEDQTDEYLVLQYQGDDKLFVPVTSLQLISRYSGADPEHAPIYKLGTNQWEKVKRKAAEKVRDVAAELLEIHAKRAARKGYAFKISQDKYFTFAESFPFEETPDQETAIGQVLDDMKSGQSMDRLICGDVGFGKTEVAIRAAFIAVENKRQVAVLVPTTLLAQQHYESFKDRFADWPIKIEVLSRFKSAKEQKEIIEQLQSGKIDIIIGTHKLLQQDIKFNELGLLIIDEEHRFGVRQKERLKALRSEVDILTLTATPIPRTLNMSLSGMRDLSIIATPPERRLSVKTFIHEYENHIIREAVLREIMRGGQVYFLHNEVQTIDRRLKELEKLIPEARIAIAHGQLHEKDLERVMGDFYHRRFNVLLCSTIIESGIDIPSANTIIIERADKFGLAQLHQLRGRVGRSHHQAYAYLLVPSKKVITKDAEKRLEAIAMAEDLGAGFTLATHDLEIRGAGEILGEEQSGHIQEIGFNLYMQMLERAVKSLKSGKMIDIDRPIESVTEIDLQIPALIPECYMPDVHMRLILYKRIASAESDEELGDLRVEMIDRFGLLLPQIRNLFEINELRIKSAKLGIRKIEAGDKRGIVEFIENPKIDPAKIIKLVQKEPDKYQFAGSNKLRFTVDPEDKIQSVEKVLSVLS